MFSAFDNYQTRINFLWFFFNLLLQPLPTGYASMMEGSRARTVGSRLSLAVQARFSLEACCERQASFPLKNTVMFSAQRKYE
jgi:hypothetical protein